METIDGNAPRERWLACGQSVDSDAFRAGAEATRAAIGDRDEVRLLIVFCADSYDLAELTRGISSASGGAPLIGCSTAGEIATAGPADASIVVTALGGPGFSVQTGVARCASKDLRGAAADAVTSCVSDLDQRAHSVVLLLTDGLAGDQMEVIRGAYEVVGAEFPLVGGCAGDGLKMDTTYQLFGEETMSDALVAAAISSDAPIGIGVQHGWRPIGHPMLVTGSRDNRVETLDDQPALDVYLRRLGAPREAWEDAEAFTRFALTHPLGISRRSGAEVRFVAEPDYEDRSIVCIASLPQGSLAWIMEGDEESVLEATNGACSDALAGLQGETPIGLLAFDCIARRGVLGLGITTEIDRISTFAHGAPVAGFYTYGEIARTTGKHGFHNQTLVVLALG